MTARQPRTPQEAAMLDPTGLMAFPVVRSGGLFGGGRRRTPVIGGAGPQYMQDLSPPPITDAPPPPADWRKMVGADLMAQLPQTPPQPMLGDTLPPSPPMRGGMLGSPSRKAPSLGMFGNVAASGLPRMAVSDKIANRGAPLPLDANGDGKKGFDWRMAAGILGDALLGLNGQQPLYAMTRIRENQAQADSRRRLAEMAQEWQYRNNQPDYATVGNRRFAFNPATGQAQTLYVAPSEAEDYAAALGAEPGTEEYNTLVSDYVLRHSGPTATANAMQEEDNRQTNRIGLEGVRQQNRLGIEGVRQGNRLQLRGTPTYRDNNPRPSSARSGGSGGGKGGVREGQTATNPQTGAKVVYRGGKWVPAQ